MMDHADDLEINQLREHLHEGFPPRLSHHLYCEENPGSSPLNSNASGFCHQDVGH